MNDDTWQDRALAAEKQARNAMSCLLLMAQNNAIPEPWQTVIKCAYLGCGGQLPAPSGASINGPER